VAKLIEARYNTTISATSAAPTGSAPGPRADNRGHDGRWGGNPTRGVDVMLLTIVSVRASSRWPVNYLPLVGVLVGHWAPLKALHLVARWIEPSALPSPMPRGAGRERPRFEAPHATPPRDEAP